MRKIFVQVLLFSLCTAAALAQQPRQITLNGIISMTTGEIFPYKIVFSEANGIIKGYSLTYKDPDDTKTLITGVLDRKFHTLTFKETEIIYSHNVRTKAYMCLVNAALQYNNGGRGNILTGPINTHEADKTSCTEGTILFTSEEEIQKVFAWPDQYDTMITMKRKVREPYTPPSAPKPPAVQEAPPVTERITAGIEKAYDWHTDTVIVDLWDGGNIDGDRVTVLLNGKPQLTGYYLQKEKKQLRLPITGTGVNTIAFLADNEGSDPPNTASIMLTDGTIKYSILAYNPKGQQALIKIKKVKK